MKPENLLQKLKEHKPIVVNYGKGQLSGEDIKEPAYYDEDIKKYVSETGIWDTNLLIEIARGEVEDTSIELEG